VSSYTQGWRPPIIPIPRQVQFICVVCGKPGMGQPGTKTHPGRCRALRHKQRCYLYSQRLRAKRQVKGEA